MRESIFKAKSSSNGKNSGGASAKWRDTPPWKEFISELASSAALSLLRMLPSIMPLYGDGRKVISKNIPYTGNDDGDKIDRC